jgi:predicted 3-demethylubiquinone-9 3-methyltransferase (glyoxalase superfamily)
MQQITPSLWFDGNAEEAISFYCSIFEDSALGDVMRAGEGGPFPAGAVIAANFRLRGQEFNAINGGPQYSFTPAVSFIVHCDSQAEVDRYWQALTAGGEEQPCGWLVDRFGLSWQIVPRRLIELLNSPDAGRAQRVMQAMLQMSRIDIQALEDAAGAG